MATTTPGFYECPRCLKRDIYFAKRVVGQIGNIIDLPQGVTNPKFGLDVEKDVALCRECGERANWIPEKVEYTESEQGIRKNKSQRLQSKFAGFVGTLGGLAVFYMASGLNRIGSDASGYYLASAIFFLFGLWAFVRGRKFE